MLVPLRHENMRGRRWPIITFALIGLNIALFLATHWTIEEQGPKRSEVRIHLILLAATHPELKVTTVSAQGFVDSVKVAVGIGWEKIGSPSRRVEDSWDAQLRTENDPEQLQQQMDALCQQFDDLEQVSILGRYGFVPAHPTAMSYLSANFLHGGWLHLIGNMWFLWLAGFILEDNWGRLIYSVFYLLAGVASMQFYAWCTPGSYMPLIGASGAVAALMGAFLVRFPKMKIEMGFIVLVFPYKFQAPAYSLLPLWVGLEFFYGAALGTSSPVAHWAHVGGFCFGMLGAYIIEKTGMEQRVSTEIDSKIAWSGDPEVVRAQDALDHGRFDEAAAILEKHVAAKPNSTDALIILQQVQWRRNNTQGYFDASALLIQAYFKSQQPEQAWHAFEEFSNAGGEKLPPATWLELIRYLENIQNLDRAVSECDRLSRVFPQEKPSLMALLTAGRLSLKRLNRPDQALRFYKAAESSPVPHLDWDANIKAGIAEAERALGQPSLT